MLSLNCKYILFIMIRGWGWYICHIFLGPTGWGSTLLELLLKIITSTLIATVVIRHKEHCCAFLGSYWPFAPYQILHCLFSLLLRVLLLLPLSYFWFSTSRTFWARCLYYEFLLVMNILYSVLILIFIILWLIKYNLRKVCGQNWS